MATRVEWTEANKNSSKELGICPKLLKISFLLAKSNPGSHEKAIGLVKVPWSPNAQAEVDFQPAYRGSSALERRSFAFKHGSSALIAFSRLNQEGKKGKTWSNDV